MTEPDWQNDPTLARWVKHVLDDMKPKMEESALIAQIVPTDEGEVKFWVELGASIMMDKPIIAIAFEGRSIPKKLRMIADEIVVLPEGVNPEGAQVVQEAIKRVFDQLDGEGK
jgi:hypothetical protein